MEVGSEDSTVILLKHRITNMHTYRVIKSEI